MRTFSSRLTRKGIAFSKSIDMHNASAALEDNFINMLKTLRLNAEENFGLKWLPCILELKLTGEETEALGESVEAVRKQMEETGL